jgi:hypothetical protein
MRHGKSIAAIGVALLAAVTFGAATAQAANPATITVTVTIQNISVSTSSGTYAFGTVASGSTTVSGDSIEVTNDGNVSETYSLDVTNPAGWTAVQAAPGADEYALHAQFNTTEPTAVSFTYANHALSTTPTACSGTKFAGNQDGESVAASGVINLWLKFEAPSSSTVFTQQSITLTITAAAG